MGSYIKQLKDTQEVDSYYPVSLSTAIYMTDDTSKTIDAVIKEKADTDSPNLTGTPTAPTASNGTNNTQIATTAFVMDAISTSSNGTEIVVSASQPSSQSSGSFWYKIV